MCIQEYEEHSDLQISNIPDFGLILAGLDMGKTIRPKCYDMYSTSGFVRGTFPSGYGIGGKPFVARYLFRKNYPKSETIDDHCRLVAQSIFDTKRVDGDVGGVIRMAIIDKDGFRDVPTSDVYEEYIEKWD